MPHPPTTMGGRWGVPPPPCLTVRVWEGYRRYVDGWGRVGAGLRSAGGGGVGGTSPLPVFGSEIPEGRHFSCPLVPFFPRNGSPREYHRGGWYQVPARRFHPDGRRDWCAHPGSISPPFAPFFRPGDPLSQNNDIISIQFAQFYVGEMMTLFSSIWRADLCRIRAIPSVPGSCKNHPVKSRPYSRSGAGDTGETACRMVPMGLDHVPYRTFHVGGVCSPFVSDTGLPGFSDGETIPGWGMSLLKGAGGIRMRSERKKVNTEVEN